MRRKGKKKKEGGRTRGQTEREGSCEVQEGRGRRSSRWGGGGMDKRLEA